MSDPNFLPAFEGVFDFGEDNLVDISEAELPDAVLIVEKGIAAGALLERIDGLDGCYIPDEDESDSEKTESATPKPVPIITIDSAIHYANELSCYLQSMKVTELYTPSGKELSVSDSSIKIVELRNALIKQKHNSNTRQTTIKNYFKPQSLFTSRPAPVTVPGSSIVDSDKISTQYLEISDYVDLEASDYVLWRPRSDSAEDASDSNGLIDMYNRLLE